MISVLLFAVMTAQSPLGVLDNRGTGASTPFRGFTGFAPADRGATYFNPDFNPEHVELKPDSVYVPDGFDATDIPMFFAEVEIEKARLAIIPPSASDVKVDLTKIMGLCSGTITFDIKAIRYEEDGEPAKATRLVRIQLAQPLPAGSYCIKYHPKQDRLEEVGKLVIAKAPLNSRKKRDNRIYPAIRSVRIVKASPRSDAAGDTEVPSSQLALRMEGDFRGIPESRYGTKCYDFDDTLPLADASLPLDKRMNLEGNVYSVLAPLKVVDDAKMCAARKSNAFTRDIVIPPGWEKNKRYLFYIPTDNGDAFTTVEALSFEGH